MDDELDAYLDKVLIGGREPVTVTIVDYDPGWEATYARYADAVRRVLSERVVAVEHIGSTAVPALAAKPTVDMLLTVPDVTDEEHLVPPLASIGLELRVREPDHLMFRAAAREVHLHVVEPHRPEIRDYLDLRDWLRADPADREHYAVTKRRLAEQSWNDMNHYAQAKSEVIQEMLERARRWRAAAT